MTHPPKPHRASSPGSPSEQVIINLPLQITHFCLGDDMPTFFLFICLQQHCFCSAGATPRGKISECFGKWDHFFEITPTMNASRFDLCHRFSGGKCPSLRGCFRNRSNGKGSCSLGAPSPSVMPMARSSHSIRAGVGSHVWSQVERHVIDLDVCRMLSSATVADTFNLDRPRVVGLLEAAQSTSGDTLCTGQHSEPFLLPPGNPIVFLIEFDTDRELQIWAREFAIVNANKAALVRAIKSITASLDPYSFQPKLAAMELPDESRSYLNDVGAPVVERAPLASPA